MVTVTAKLSNGATETLRARAAIVAVPLSILQDGDIAFEPPLPAATVDAFKTIGWQRDGVKILCARAVAIPHSTFAFTCISAHLCAAVAVLLRIRKRNPRSLA